MSYHHANPLVSRMFIRIFLVLVIVICLVKADNTWQDQTDEGGLSFALCCAFGEMGNINFHNLMLDGSSHVQ